MRIVLMSLALLLATATTASAGGHDLTVAWLRYFGYHNGAGYHAPKPCRQCGPSPDYYGSPIHAEPVLPAPHVTSPYHAAVQRQQVPASAPPFRLEREVNGGPHFFPVGK